MHEQVRYALADCTITFSSGFSLIVDATFVVRAASRRLIFNRFACMEVLASAPLRCRALTTATPVFRMYALRQSGTRSRVDALRVVLYDDAAKTAEVPLRMHA
ncbi:uncharacterized protein SCHCODRAFT_02704153 [Schizophyllum commune H4-8]|uniref:uncharacterized protein n=1 Tax=Schizophyllum commune (strain H4-8 / FGSC 9210) TaxID=578458 RepID=UPI002160E885|nr:uncharacterized protein SCHCODRAFT_02704153 [Schizophyllum commune H4-8]KAI5888109.1 hypothetical protein SCHCODRAFT_02704153 [Schizophyllum commune H4-8]